MIIRFVVKNLFSFKDETEFNLLPARLKRLEHHKYEKNGVEVLKLSALYGANGSGKSNLIKSISLLQEMLLTGIIPNAIFYQKFKLSQSNSSEPVELAIEFFAKKAIYYYEISVNNGIVMEEYFSKHEKNIEESLIFHRKNEEGKTSIRFFEKFEIENRILKEVIERDLLKAHQPIFNLLNEISNESFSDIKAAYYWFANNLSIIIPETKIRGMEDYLDNENEFKNFANKLMCSFNTGMTNLKVEVKEIDDFLKNENHQEIEEMKIELKNNPNKRSIVNDHLTREDFLFSNQQGKIVGKKLIFEHKDDINNSVAFNLNEESDGTRRLFEYLPAWYDLATGHSTFIIDEIERSIHPIIIKELISKFSKDKKSKGQLIFSTHESNLLDQDILRTDEIWFAEKNNVGATKLYPLSEFKEHSTIDISKGYLNGRYGGIPFTGDLQDLNWNISTHAQ